MVDGYPRCCRIVQSDQGHSRITQVTVLRGRQEWNPAKPN